MLELRDVKASHGTVPALFGVSLRVGEGEGLALLGRNGAGKSSILRAILGLMRVTVGEITLGGRSLIDWPLHARIRAGLGWVPEDRRVFAGLSVAENIAIGTRNAAGPWTTGRLKALFPKLDELWTRRAGTLSGGEQQMLTIARTLAGNPRVLLLDEPSEGLAPLVVADLGRAVAAIKAEGVALLLSEQNMTLARGLADRACLIDRGRGVWSGAMADLAKESALQARYLAV
ncbi:ABC transporter ATP-binding protein [Rhodospirillum rubrum]|uniref:ABC transporter ATP-binding protein n=1 Tax=Rhodospirillum rubrum TaxID=1085 RepID=UPI001908B135|nr:ABC transporter ATP-binding protein [Rhodospirillum rubrum]MBK1663269.1 ABC transporter ATP-binding protein [Rhodospirillum rubrum]MBK1677075.1 ABC transporter ATP-binding protein [Rhodospirillum rubrum]